ncbi:MAG TPA: hypothetical protein VIL74_01410 [Pyrinomonadaceae bacterium]|jgi:hypothetical protein
MRSKILNALFILTIGALPAFAGEGAVSGIWKISGSVYNTPVEMTCTINQDDKKLSGSCKADQLGEKSITGEVSDRKVQWKLDTDYNGMQLTLVFNGTLDDKASNITGKIDVQPMNIEGDFSAKKEESKKEEPKKDELKKEEPKKDGQKPGR